MLVREIPMKEKYDTEGFPIMRVFNYQIPKSAIRDLIRRELVITGVVSYGVLDEALAEEGFGVSGINLESKDDSYRYEVDIAWADDHKFRLQIPSMQIYREAERAMYEFCGLDDVIRAASSVKLLPEVFAYEEWEASIKV
jgi:hypothetical protein